MRAINNIVDATNYAMIELGEPLHAFDYDVLKERAGDKKIKIITRAAKDGEKLTTLDGVERKLTSMNVLVCDEKGSLSLAGVMGGSESKCTMLPKKCSMRKASKQSLVNCRREKSLRVERAQLIFCSKARRGTSSTFAAQQNSTTFLPKHRSAFRAACILRLRNRA